jgi:ribonuclease R
MTDRLSRRILDYISDTRYAPRRTDALAEELGVPDDELPDFRKAVEQLLEQDQVVLSGEQTIALPPPGKEMIGLFRANERGFGFIQPDSRVQHGDLFVPPGNTAGAMTGDRVRAEVVRERGRAGGARSPFIGRILEIVTRAEKRYTGNLIKRGSMFYVEVDGRVLPKPVIIRDPHAKEAKVGDKVVFELVEYPSEDSPAEGVIIEVLGEGGEPAVETLATMRAYSLPDKFPEEVVQNAREAARTFSDDAIPEDREDLTGILTLTIDPPDAKDFDDAINISRLDPKAEQDGAAWELGIHIADVAHFVKAGSPLDVEAKERGNSVYLPRKVVPMLPELLSNGVCSLQEGVNRFTKSVFIRLDESAHVLSARFARGVIRSAKRMTYLEAQGLIDDDLKAAARNTKSEPHWPRPIIQALKAMDELAKVIRQRRLKSGMIVLGLPEVELIYDDAGNVRDAVPEDNAFTHTLIEMFMVEANEAAARLFNDMSVSMIRRIHPDPDVHDMSQLRTFARVAGYNIPRHPSRRELQELLDSVRDKPAQHAVHLAVLKTLSRAEYAPLEIGHFALASEHYTHFTSPIRRYADLIVHRGLDVYLNLVRGQDKQGGRRKNEIAKAMRRSDNLPPEQELVEIGRHLSMTERNAQSAENNLRTYLILDLLSNHLGEDFEGTCTGVTSSGIFVQLDRYLIDGFCKVDDLPGERGERWQLNRNTGAMVAQRSGRIVNIGDRFVVRIAVVNPSTRQMELVIIEKPGKPGTKQRVGNGDGNGNGASPKKTRPGKKPRLQQKTGGDTLNREKKRTKRRRR